MNCAAWEERIALYLGGDLEQPEAAEVERHLGECAGCQLFASGMRESLRLLREAHTDEPLEGAYAAVRARVLGKLERRPFWQRPWVYVFAAAAAMLAIWMAIPRRPVHAPVVANKEVLFPAPPPRAPEVAEVRPVIRRAAHHPRRRAVPKIEIAAAVKPEPPLVVKLVTDDPDVVIYWITDTRGEMR